MTYDSTLDASQASELIIDETDQLRIVLEGDWDLCEAPRLREALDTVDARRKVIFDLSTTSYLDSSALRVLVEFKKRSLEMGGLTAIYYGENARAERVLSISGVGSLFI